MHSSPAALVDGCSPLHVVVLRAVCAVDALSAVGVYVARNEIGDKGVAEDVPSERLEDVSKGPLLIGR